MMRLTPDETRFLAQSQPFLEAIQRLYGDEDLEARLLSPQSHSFPSSLTIISRCRHKSTSNCEHSSSPPLVLHRFCF